MNRRWLKNYDDGVPASLEYPEITLPQFLVDTAAEHPEYIVTTLNGDDISYRELDGKVNALARALGEMGVVRGDRVALILPNSPTYVIATYAVMKLGAIVVNINVMSHGEELSSFINDSGSRIAITLDIFLQNVIDIVNSTCLEEIVIHSVLGMEKKVETADGLPEIKSVNDLVSAFPQKDFPLQCQVDDAAVLQYTSGSTGTPKAAVLTHRNVVSNVIQVGSWNPHNHEGNPAVICIIPFFHVFGMTICLHLSVYSGYRMVLIPIFDWSSIVEFLNVIKAYRPISFPAVPALFAALVSFPDVAEYPLSSIEIASVGGAPVPLWVQEEFENLTGKKLSVAYGLSEASSSTHISPFRNGAPPGSIGIPLPDTDARIVHVETGVRECPSGDVGELTIKGPQIMQGYWNNKDLTEKSLRNGWFYTGDLAYMDENGFFYIVDRKDDLIISSGFNVYPSDIEKALTRHAGVKDAGVVGAPDRIRGESIVAFVVMEEGMSFDREELFNHCRRHLPEYKVPRRITQRDDIPYNRVGKPLRKVLREELQRRKA
ncbi:MAG: long-chain fatty acid--CoA ligase [Thermodesulfobacteriota bacterium]